ncbi:hypothetical protein [Allokutzneria albata]|uniref:Epoxide hydrolase n=1 Tax=Allokutzneria albata TaxID=211114 RepID=A0A1G9UV84_ALLAB|nr:hypothetical protein [Allokutzneria albata]SDM63861.1 hypothetical protein SAMN04489726_2651 [Allokutzneria albata]
MRCGLAQGGVVQAQQPQTLAHTLADSPVGLLGWNAQAMHEHGLDNDAILTTVAVGVARFPGDLPSIRVFSEHHHNIVSWNEYDRGGHYAAQDAPDLLAHDIREFFTAVRSVPSNRQ